MIVAGAQRFKMTVQARGQVTLPKKLRAVLDVQPGDTVVAVPDGQGGYHIERFEPMTVDEMFARWGDPTPVDFEEVERQIQQAREEFAEELAREYRV